MLTLEKFQQASKIVKEVTLPTKLVYSEYLSRQTGADVYLKPENMQYTGAYKVRGAYYKISTMSEEDRKKGLVTASAGNHAQGVAYAAKKFGCKATVVMPTVTPLIKVNRTKSYGADVVLHGDVYDDACAYAMKLAEEEGYTFVHPFDDLDVATGQGSIAMEIFDELPDVDYILAPIGGGGLITGVSTLTKMLNPDVKVIAIEPATSPVLSQGHGGAHKIQGIGAGFVPDVLNTKIYDEVFPVENEKAFEYGKELAKAEGIITGISSGAALYAAVEVAKRPENEGKTIVVLLPDNGDRYYSTALFQ